MARGKRQPAVKIWCFDVAAAEGNKRKKKGTDLRVGQYEPRGKWHDASGMNRYRAEKGARFIVPLRKRWRIDGAGETDV